MKDIAILSNFLTTNSLTYLLTYFLTHASPRGAFAPKNVQVYSSALQTRPRLQNVQVYSSVLKNEEPAKDDKTSETDECGQVGK